MKEDFTELGLALETNSLAVSRVEQIERGIQDWAGKAIKFSFDPSGTELFSMEELARSFAKRAMDFSQSIRTLLSEDRIVPATVLGRALIETIAMGCLFLHDMERLIAARDRERLEQRFHRFYLGIKGKEIEPIHVMDAMRHLEKIDAEYFEYLETKYGFFSRFIQIAKDAGHSFEAKDPREVLSAIRNYNLLSEVSHPNGLGTQFLYGEPSNADTHVEQLRKRFRQAALSAIWQCHHLLVALDHSADMADRFRNAFLKT